MSSLVVVDGLVAMPEQKGGNVPGHGELSPSARQGEYGNPNGLPAQCLLERIGGPVAEQAVQRLPADDMPVGPQQVLGQRLGREPVGHLPLGVGVTSRCHWLPLVASGRDQ